MDGYRYMTGLSFKKSTDFLSVLQAVVARHVIGVENVSPVNMLVIRDPMTYPVQIYHVGSLSFGTNIFRKPLARRVFARTIDYNDSLKCMWDKHQSIMTLILEKWQEYFLSKRFEELISDKLYQMVIRSTRDIFRNQIVERVTSILSNPVGFSNRELVVKIVDEESFSDDEVDYSEPSIRIRENASKKRKRAAAEIVDTTKGGVTEQTHPPVKRPCLNSSNEQRQHQQSTVARTAVLNGLHAPVFVDLNEGLPPLLIEELFA
jgi:hypothetical protein